MMQASLARRGLFAASILTIVVIAVTARHARADDAGSEDDASLLDGATPDGSGATGDGSVTPGDASGTTGADATVGSGVDGSSEAGLADAAPGPQYVQPDGSLPTYSGGDIFSALCVQNPNAATFSFDTVPAPYTTPAGCTSFDAQGHTAAHTCLCNASACFPLMQQCDALPGCRAIWKCEHDSACTSPTTCYLAPGAPCASVIDLWGTGSVATALTQYIFTCSAALTPACSSM